MTYLQRIAPKDGIDFTSTSSFPFNVPTIRSLGAVELKTAVTFFVGENGSGKSTLLEAIASNADLTAFGGYRLADDATLKAQRLLASSLRLSWAQRTRSGFFMRAEDFFGHAKRMAFDDARIAREQHEMDTRQRTTSGDASDVHVDERNAAKYLNRYDSRSHGESFLDLFTQHVRGRGIYLLDEPEGPLSPRRQLALLALIVDRARMGAQFVVATHSPILTACPGATIYSFDGGKISQTAYVDLDQVAFMRDFLSNTESYVKRL